MSASGTSIADDRDGAGGGVGLARLEELGERRRRLGSAEPAGRAARVSV